MPKTNAVPRERALATAFDPMESPRSPVNRRHLLSKMVVIAIAAVFAGADGWQHVERFGRAKAAWLRQFLTLPCGIPSHDTFGRVFGLLDPQAFEACFRTWALALCALIPGEIIAVDGKTLRRSHDRSAGLAALHLVSARATVNLVVLGQVATEAKSNEITAISQLLAFLHLRGCLVSIDGMGCETKIAEQLVAQGGDYVLALKGNQSTLATEVEDAFISADAKDDAGMDSQCLETVERDHGRVEGRRGTAPLGDLAEAPRSALWQGMNMIGRVEAESTVDGKTPMETRYHIGSIGTAVACFARAVRGHWGIENTMHWTLEMTFREDECRVRQSAARENLAMLRRIALSRLKQDDAKFSLRNKRNTAGWDDRYLAELLFEAPNLPPSARSSGASNITAN
jgi:predicted transposase YbfD/YdcC